MKIAIIGSGGREHALAARLASEVGSDNVWMLPGNGGWNQCHSVNINDNAAVVSACKQLGIQLAVIGPEAPLAADLATDLNSAQIPTMGPSANAAQLESSKLWAKAFMARHDVVTAPAVCCSTMDEAREAIAQMQGQCAVKYDGLAAGKGVIVCNNADQAEAACASLWSQFDPTLPILIEERLSGPELSVLTITDGEGIVILPSSQDYKRAGEEDSGPNTGGMGAISPSPYWNEQLEESIRRSIINPTLQGLKQEGIDYKGFLYFGIMLTSQGPALLEYNCRLGDPETQVVLQRLESSLLPLIQACLDGTLSEQRICISPETAAGVVLASSGYPGDCILGCEINGLDLLDQHVQVFHAGTRRKSDGSLTTSGGRILCVTSKQPSLSEALSRCYLNIGLIEIEGAFYRTDIGSRQEVLQ